MKSNQDWTLEYRRRLALATRATAIGMVISAMTYAQTPGVGSSPAMATDRPDVTESSIVVPKGSLQVEYGATWSVGHGAQAFDLSESLVRLGVSNRTEIRFVVPTILPVLEGHKNPGLVTSP